MGGKAPHLRSGGLGGKASQFKYNAGGDEVRVSRLG